MSSVDMAEVLGEVARRVRDRFAAASVECEVFHSGGAMLSVRHGGRLFVLARTAKGEFGVDEVLADEGFQTGYRFRYENLGAAEASLLSLLAGRRPAKGT
jgi:hypothetical protein